MAAEASLDRLRHQNPFVSSSVGDPWESHYPHVPSINEQAFQGLCHLMAHKTRDPALNCAGLILGEVGSGKTHLLSRILAHGTQAQPPCAFAYIQPFEDPEQAYRYLLREIMVNLCRPVSTAPHTTQLEDLLAAMVIEVLRQHSRPTGQHKLHTILQEHRNVLRYVRPPVFAYVQQWAVDLLRRTSPEISARFLEVLLQSRLPEQRPAAINWLKGDVLDQGEAERLGVPDRLPASASYLEQEARDILISLGVLLGRYRRSLVVCFDRLENLETTAQIQAFGRLLEFLVDTAQGMLPLACVRGQQWEETFRYVLNQHVTSRLETNSFVLQGCTAEQALALVRSRLATVLDAEQAEALFPFDPEELRQMFQTGFHSPRTVIARANARLRRILEAGVAAPASPLQTLQEAYERQYQAIWQDFERYPPDRARLRRALELYVSHTPPTHRSWLEPVRRPETEDKYIDLIGTLQSVRASPLSVVFLIDVEPHHTAVGASLARGCDVLETQTASLVVYLREARCAFPSPSQWPATNEKLEHFRALGGKVIFLERERAARWYALALLSYAVREGDVTLVTAAHEVRPVSPDEFAAFIQHAFYGDLSPAFQDIEAVCQAS
jgi:hypothetical protein